MWCRFSENLEIIVTRLLYCNIESKVNLRVCGQLKDSKCVDIVRGLVRRLTIEKFVYFYHPYVGLVLVQIYLFIQNCYFASSAINEFLKCTVLLCLSVSTYAHHRIIFQTLCVRYSHFNKHIHKHF